MNHGWEKKTFNSIADTLTPISKIDKSEYLSKGLYPIVSQEESLVSGFWNDGKDITPHSSPVVIFGDHSRVLKYVDFEFVVGADGVKIIYPKKGLSAKYLYHYLKWYKIPSLGYSRHFKLIKDAQYLVPPLHKQELIVSELDKINELIELKRNQLTDLDLMAQSLFYEMFGEPIENPKGWSVYKLGECVDFKNGLNFTPSENGNKVKCLGVGNFKSNRYITSDNLPIICIEESLSEDYLLADGDIVFVRSNGNKALIGRSILYGSKNEAVTFSGFCIRCRFDQTKYNPLYMSYLFSSKTIRNHMTSKGKGCNISNINQKILSSIPVIMPPVDLQNHFADNVQLIEEQKKLVEDSIKDLETLLASRMDYWFN